MFKEVYKIAYQNIYKQELPLISYNENTESRKMDEKNNYQRNYFRSIFDKLL